MTLSWSQPKTELTVKEYVRIYSKPAKNVPWMHLFIHSMQDHENQRLIPSGRFKIIFLSSRNGLHYSLVANSSSELNSADVQKLDSYH